MYKKTLAKYAGVLLQNLQMFLTFILLCAIIIIVKERATARNTKDITEVKNMKFYEVTKIVINRRGRLMSKETWCIAFNTLAEMNHYMNGKWSMAKYNESYKLNWIQFKKWIYLHIIKSKNCSII